MNAEQPMNGKHPVCGAKTRSGGTCKLPAGSGTSHPGVGRCRFHGGRTPNHERAAARTMGALLAEEMAIEPQDAVLWVVRAAAGEVAFFTGQVRVLEDAMLLVQAEERREGGEGWTRRVMTDATLHAWIRARHDAMDRLARYSKIAHDMGIDERQVRLAEQFGSRFSSALGIVLSHFGLLEHPEAPDVVRRAMRELEEATEE